MRWWGLCSAKTGTRGRELKTLSLDPIVLDQNRNRNMKPRAAHGRSVPGLIPAENRIGETQDRVGNFQNPAGGAGGG